MITTQGVFECAGNQHETSQHTVFKVYRAGKSRLSQGLVDRLLFYIEY